VAAVVNKELNTTPQSSSQRKIRLFVLLAIVVLPVVLIGTCLTQAIGPVISAIRRYQDEERDRAAAEANPRFRRPLSSTAGRVLFVARNNAIDDFYVVNVDGSELTRLTRLPQDPLHSSPPVISPDGTRLAISVGGVLLVRLDRPEVTRLDRPGGLLAWSPDGNQLASLSLDDQRRLHLHLFDAEAAGPARDIAASWPSTVAGDSQFVQELAWSPDAKWFAFTLFTRPGYKRSAPRHNHLYIASGDGRGLTNLSREPNALVLAPVGGLAWAPDGRRLAVAGRSGIAVVDVNLNWADIPVPVIFTDWFQQPAWSPDGTRLAWFNDDSIVVSDPDGRHQEELTRGRCRGVHPSWSPDGSRIALVCLDSRNRSSLFVMNSDGSGLTQVTKLGGDAPIDTAGHYQLKFPVWLPPGRSATEPGEGSAAQRGGRE
jgi:Tol biopolymer transport system component